MPFRKEASRLRRTSSYKTIQNDGYFWGVSAAEIMINFGAIFAPAVIPECGKRADVQQADIFISHTWSSGRWAKYLAMCMHLNLGKAVFASIFSWLLMILIMAGRSGIGGLGGSRLLLPCWVYGPMAVFFVAFFFGHKFFEPSRVYWFDKLCVDQTDEALKRQQVECLPVFVANSNEMLVLWDDTYFQRLWCNMEVACFIKHAGPERVRFLPLWIAPWLLSSMLLDLISATIFEVLELSFPNWSMAWVAQVEAAVLALGSPPELTRFFAAFFIWMFSGLCYLPSSVPSFFSFRARLRSHTLLLEQMSSFRVQEAKCTEEWDRQLIEAQVVELYRDTGKSAEVEEHEYQHELERFNSYIQGPLRKVVLKSIGDELSVPYHLCLIAYLPMTFYSAVNVLGCDNGPCMRSVKEGGFSSLELYLMVQAVAWLLCMLLAFPMTHPTLLFLLHKFSPSDDSTSSSTFAALISCLVAFAYGFFLGACIWGIAFCLADGITVIRLLVTVVVLASLLFQTYMIFLKPRGDQNKIGGG